VVRARRHAVIALLAAPFALPATAASAAEPAELYNANGQNHVPVCATLALPQADLRFGDTSPTGFSVHDQLTFNDGRCPSNTVRLDFHEIFPAGTAGLVFHRGGNGYTDEPNTKYGHLLTGDLASALPEPVPSGGGRGAPCSRLASEPPYRVSVRSIPEEMHYKHPSELPNGSNKGSSFEHYGDPGADQGSRTDIHYSYLLWSFVNVRGGGIVRTLLAPNQVIRACDVDPVTMDSWDREGNVNGSVTARYVQALAGACRVYGWAVWTHRYDPAGPAPVAHASPDPAAPADPAPDARCPVAEGPKPPTIATGDAAGREDGTATISATVHPEGTPTGYNFEYGPTPDLGSGTAPRPVSVAMRTNTVTADLGGLEPGATYHYRVIAANEHGDSFGAVRSFTVPEPPEPPPPPPPEPVALSGLKVSPKTMRRSRSRTGTSASIRWTLTKPATVTLTFEQARRGMVVGKRCKTPPRRGVPRGRRRCTRWVEVRGSLVRQSDAGPVKLRFGGWIARRPLRAGRYRVEALPADGGPAATPRVAGFRIR
jgi:hypothetical protein